MQLEGLHHITMVTAEAQLTVDFYSGVLGLRLVKQTVNFDAPDMYHLYFGDDAGSPGSLLTWFEIRGARAGRAGDGMIHRIELGVPTADSLDWWHERLADAGCMPTIVDGELHFADREGLSFALIPDGGTNPPLQAATGDVPAAHAITGVLGARAFGNPDADSQLIQEALGFTAADGTYRVDGVDRTCGWAYDPGPAEPGIQGAGTVHHIAWCSRDGDLERWQERAAAAGQHVTQVLDRDYFQSIYFRVPGGVLFEIATEGPGFAVDEDPQQLGRELRVPAMHADNEADIRALLTPLEVPGALA